MSAVKTVNFDDGQGLDPVDFIALQKRLQAQSFDLLVRSRMRELETSTPSGATDPRIYAVGAGGGVKATVTNLQTSNRAGVIAFLPDRDSVPDGEDATALVYYLTEGELVTTHAAAHATLDRWDLVCVKLAQVVGNNVSRNFEDATTRQPTSQTTDVDRTVTLTKQIVVGANAAAGSAVEPAVPAGFARWAAVKVPATLAAPFTPSLHFRDHRVPLGQVDVAFILPKNGYLDGFVSDTSRLTGGVKAAAANNFCFVPLGIAPKTGRIMRLHIRAKITNGGGIGQIILSRSDMNQGADGALIIALGHTGGVMTEYDIISNGVVMDLGGSPLPQVGPLWGTGFASVEAGIGSEGTHCCASINFTAGAAGDIVEVVRVEMAGP